MNDELFMNNYLLILKSTVEVFVHGTLESSNENVRSLLKENLGEILTSQANTYDEMVKYGWYKVNNVESSKIMNTLSNVKNN
ncbi:MAG: spore coat protein [Bacilli bacterium]|nr:spore coat protein [Bacilli bacterium]